MKSYQDLEIYTKSMDLFFRTHKFSLNLPNYEKYELGSQLRRSSDSINSNIVEGYGRRGYKMDFIKFLAYSHASTLECRNHLIKIKSPYPQFESEGETLIQEYDLLGIMIFKFLDYVEKNWKT